MKRVIYYIATGVLVMAAFLAGSAVQVGASEYVNQADIDVYLAVDKAIVAFADETRRESATIQSIDAKAKAAESALNKLVGHSYNTDLGQQYTDEAAVLKEKAAALAGTIVKAADVYERGDQVAMDSFLAQLESETVALEAQILKVDEAVDAANNSTGNVYLLATTVGVLLVVGSSIWAFASRKKITKGEFGYRRAVAIASLWPFAGALITYISFLFSDGQYMILWGLVLFGLALYKNEM